MFPVEMLVLVLVLLENVVAVGDHRAVPDDQDVHQVPADVHPSEAMLVTFVAFVTVYQVHLLLDA